MQVKLNVSFILIMLCVAWLSACSKKSDPVPIAPEDVEGATSDMSNDVKALLDSAENNEGLQAINELLSLGISFDDFQRQNSTPQAIEVEEGKLPRGNYDFNSSTDEFDKKSNSNNLVLNWTYGDNNKPAVATTNWGNNIKIVEGEEGEQEVPTNASFTMQANSIQVANLNLQASWYNANNCGTADGILEPTNATLNGNIAIINLQNIGFRISDTNASTQGKIEVSSGGETASFSWNVSLNGQIQRSATTCFLEDFDINSGNVSLVLTSNSHSFAFKFDFNDVVMDADGVITSVKLSNGEIRLDNEIALTFAGTLDNNDEDDVFGENVVVTFSNGETSTLEDVIIDNRDIFTSINSLGNLSLLDAQQAWLLQGLDVLSVGNW